MFYFFFFQAEDGIRDLIVTGVQTCALPICGRRRGHVDGDEAVRRADLGEAPQHARPEQRRDARDGGAAEAHGFAGFAVRARRFGVFLLAAAWRLTSASSRSRTSMRARARLNSERVGTFMVRSACATAWSIHSLPRTAACMARMKRGLLMSSFETWVKNSSPRARR